MNAPGITPCKALQSEIIQGPTKNHETIQQLKSLFDLFSTLYSEDNHTLLQNSSQGHVTMTSSLARMLPSLKTKDPIIKLFLTSIENHIKVYCEGGMLSAFLCLKIFLTSLSGEIKPHVISNIYDWLLDKVVIYLQSDQSSCKKEFNFANIDMLKHLVRSQLSAYTSTYLNDTEIQHMIQLVVNAFVSSIPEDGDYSDLYNIQYQCVEGKPPLESHLIDGLLYQMPHLTLKKSVSVILSGLTSKTDATKVVLYNISLSGDSEVFSDMNFEIKVPSVQDNEVDTLHDSWWMNKILTQLKRLNIDILACQKVVHPTLTKMCQNEKILVIDRLGEAMANQLLKMTDSQAVTLMTQKLEETHIGLLSEVKALRFAEKTFLTLQGKSSNLKTMVLCHRYEEPLQELKERCEAANHVLKLTLYNPYVFVTKGQWLLDVASHIAGIIGSCDEGDIKSIGCTCLEFVTAGRNLLKCFKHVAVSSDEDKDSVDLIEAELEDICVGLDSYNVKTSDELTDHYPEDDKAANSAVNDDKLYSFRTQTKALYCAVKTALLLLKIDKVIINPN